MKYKHVKGKLHFGRRGNLWRVIDPFGQSLFGTKEEAKKFIKGNLNALNILLSPRFWGRGIK